MLTALTDLLTSLLTEVTKRSCSAIHLSLSRQSFPVPFKSVVPSSQETCLPSMVTGLSILPLDGVIMPPGMLSKADSPVVLNCKHSCVPHTLYLSSQIVFTVYTHLHQQGTLCSTTDCFFKGSRSFMLVTFKVMVLTS